MRGFPSTVGILVLAALTCSCDPGESSTPVAEPTAMDAAVVAEPWFREEPLVGVDFRQEAGAQGDYWYPEAFGSGAAVLDADGDGRFDLYVADGGRLPGSDQPLRRNRLYLERGPATYVDHSEASGTDDAGYSTGCVAGDVDNDGDVDLYVGNVGPDVFFLNRGDATFERCGREAGVDNPEWTTSITMLDFDVDGFLDVYVANYVRWPPTQECADFAGRREYCNPKVYPPAPDVLYRGTGTGSFEDVSDALGVRVIPRRGLGVHASDFDGDGWTDVYVANDGEENHLWLNRRGQSFDDVAMQAGVAFNCSGTAEASMGVTVGDVDADGDLDIFITHLRKETNTLYLNDGSATFTDQTAQAGLAALSVIWTGFGTVMFDADLDGLLDLAVVNGRVVRGDNLLPEPIEPFWDDYAEPNHLFHGVEGGRFERRPSTGEPFCSRIEVSRALVPADVDDDGDLDFFVTNIQGPVRFYRNVAPRQGHWLLLEVRDAALRRAVIGAMVRVRAGGRTYLREVQPGISYQTSGDSRVQVGLGQAAQFEEIEVLWPGGERERFPGGETDRRIVLERGTGETVPRE